MNEKSGIQLVKTVMDKNKEVLQNHKAETFIEIQSVKDQIMDQLEKNSNSTKDLEKNIEVLETKLVKNGLTGAAAPKTTYSRLVAELEKNEFKDKLEKWQSNTGQNDFMFETPLIENQIVIHDPSGAGIGLLRPLPGGPNLKDEHT